MRYVFGKLTNSKLILIDEFKDLNIFKINDDNLDFIGKIGFDFKEDEYFRTFEFLKNGELETLIIGKKNGIIEFIDLNSKQILKKIELPLSNDYYLNWNLDILKLSNNKKWLTVGQTWYTVYPMNMETFSTKEISIPAQPLKIKYSKDDNYVALIHGEQGGQGLFVYYQDDKVNWITMYEHWAINSFEFSESQNVIYHFGINKADMGVLTKINLDDNNQVLWQKFYTLEELGDTNVHNYGFGLFSLIEINENLEFGINSKLFRIDAMTGETLSLQNMKYKIIDIIKNKNLKCILTESEINLQKI